MAVKRPHRRGGRDSRWAAKQAGRAIDTSSTIEAVDDGRRAREDSVAQRGVRMAKGEHEHEAKLGEQSGMAMEVFGGDVRRWGMQGSPVGAIPPLAGNRSLAHRHISLSPSSSTPSSTPSSTSTPPARSSAATVYSIPYNPCLLFQQPLCPSCLESTPSATTR